MKRARSGLWVLLLLAIGVVAWRLALDGRPPASPPGEAHTRAVEPAPGTTRPAVPPAARRPNPGRSRRTQPAPPAPLGYGACALTDDRHCHAGDVHLIDTCGQPVSLAEECGNSLCRDGSCQKGDGSACDGPPEGRCEGGAVVACVAGRPRRIDCQRLGKRCVMTHEGALCRAPSPSDCERHGPLPRCEGDTLLHCVEGSLTETVCDALDPGATCGVFGNGGPPRCIALARREEPPRRDPVCGPCGCDEGNAAAEPGTEAGDCDGVDNDQDGYIDEDASCEPVPVVPVVITDAAGRSSYSPADLEAEAERINQTLGSAPAGLELSVDMRDPVYLARSEWRSLEGDELDALLRSSELAEVAPDFAVPVVFTDELIMGDTPKLGLATLPNGRCGGRRVTSEPVPDYGGVVVAKTRLPTTVAHELGHYLGLCHTHFDYDGSLMRAVSWPLDDGRVAIQACQARCQLEGDGICDTPADPGPEACGYDRLCQVHCATGDQPDARNVMSYYSDCRTRLSAQQAQQLRRGLSLRKGYHRCRDGACPCDPTTPSCPDDMTCRPTRSGYRCGLDGPRPPGAPCDHHLECGQGSLCASDGHCRLPCNPAQTRCQCIVDEPLGLRVCG